MKISKITTQKKNKDRYNIFIKDEYAFSVDEDVLIKYELRKGLDLSEELISEIQAEDDLQKAYNKVINYLSYRMRSEKEVRSYLHQEEITQTQVDRIVGRLKKSKLIDDLQFAEMFVRSRMNTSSKGPGLIRQELQEKGIQDEFIQEALEQFERDVQEEKALKLVQKRLRRRRKDSFQKQLDQARAALLRNGYPSSVINTVMDQVGSREDQEAEWEAILNHGERLERRFKGKFTDYELQQKIKEGLYRQGFSIGIINEYLQTRS